MRFISESEGNGECQTNRKQLVLASKSLTKLMYRLFLSCFSTFCIFLDVQQEQEAAGPLELSYARHLDGWANFYWHIYGVRPAHEPGTGGLR